MTEDPRLTDVHQLRTRASGPDRPHPDARRPRSGAHPGGGARGGGGGREAGAGGLPGRRHHHPSPTRAAAPNRTAAPSPKSTTRTRARRSLRVNETLNDASGAIARSHEPRTHPHHFPLDPASRQVAAGAGREAAAVRGGAVRYWEQPDGLPRAQPVRPDPGAGRGDGERRTSWSARRAPSSSTSRSSTRARPAGPRRRPSGPRRGG